ncbi:sensor histidine kinase [Streptomyces calidiresistens]|uniref:histidine kinase n=1 Tax=Streptomyces calidiresistens TaxID=1485586 RepID=A0A7W3T1V6_9ACTN|nr:histidine kinase [Streptomyces calidiresistens]MBB0229321.1 sensor histidine kinase [Streptomyces calidiresistens]
MTETGVEPRGVPARAPGAGEGPARPPSGFLWWPRRRSALLDSCLALLSAAECAAQGIVFAGRAGLPTLPVMALGALAGSLLVLRRRSPVAVILIAIAVLPAQMGWVMASIGLYTLATSEVPRRVVASFACMVGMGSILVSVLSLDGGDLYREQGLPTWFTLLVSTMFAMLTVFPPVLLGLYVRARRRLVESLRERADGLERELALLAERAGERAEWARREERTRIAREMHDVVAHRVSLMVVHSAALGVVVREDPERAAENAALIGDMGRRALTELRTMLGVLRADETTANGGAIPAPGPGAGSGVEPAPAPGRRSVPAAGGAPDSDPRAGDDGPGPDRSGGRSLPASGGGAAAGGPAGPRPDGREPGGARVDSGGPVDPADAGPRLRDLADLVEQSRAAGMEVRLSVEGTVREHPPVVESTAYRVVQEALTNVHKHAAGASTVVRVAHREEELAVQVRNGPPPDTPGADPVLPSGGNGLVGMRERVKALGGGFVCGVTPEGGFRVSAMLPDRAGRPVR